MYKVAASANFYNKHWLLYFDMSKIFCQNKQIGKIFLHKFLQKLLIKVLPKKILEIRRFSFIILFFNFLVQHYNNIFDIYLSNSWVDAATLLNIPWYQGRYTRQPHRRISTTNIGCCILICQKYFAKTNRFIRFFYTNSCRKC